MLVLSRNVGDSFTIGDDILVRIVGVYDNKVKLGIVAPGDFEIIRDDAKGENHGTSQRKVKVFGRAHQDLSKRAKAVF